MSKKITEGLNAQQRSVPQLPAQAKARHISVLGAKKDPKHPFSGYMVGSDESVEDDRTPIEESPFGDDHSDIDQHIKEEWNRERTGDWNGYWEVEMKNRPFYRAKLKAPTADVAVDLLRRRGVSGFKDATDDELNVQPGTHKNRDLEEDRTQPVNEGWNDFTVDGYRYEPWEENEFDGDNSKIHHSVKLPSGEVVSVDWDPYDYMEPEDLKSWIDLGMPKRIGIGPLNKAVLHDLENRKGHKSQTKSVEQDVEEGSRDHRSNWDDNFDLAQAAKSERANKPRDVVTMLTPPRSLRQAQRQAQTKPVREALGTLYFFDVNKTPGSFTDQQLRALGLQQSKSGKWYTNNPQSAQTIAKRLNVQARPWNPAVRESNPAAEWPEFGNDAISEAANPAQQAAIAIAIKKKNKAAAQKAVKEDITQEDVISKLKAKLGDYLSDIGQKIKNDPDLKDKVSAPKDAMGPAVKTITTDSGETISIHGNEDDGFRVSIKNKPAKAKFKTVDEAAMACKMFNARRNNGQAADYMEEDMNLQDLFKKQNFSEQGVAGGSLNEFAPSPGFNYDDDDDGYPRVPEKFNEGDVVWITPNLPEERDHFTKNCPAIVMYSYESKHGGRGERVYPNVDLDDPELSDRDRKYYKDEARARANRPHTYALVVLGKDFVGEKAWYSEKDLTKIFRGTDPAVLCRKGDAYPFADLPADIKQALVKALGAPGIKEQGIAEGTESEQSELAKKIRELLAAGKDREANHLRHKLNNLRDRERDKQKRQQGVAEDSSKWQYVVYDAKSGAIKSQHNTREEAENNCTQGCKVGKRIAGTSFVSEQDVAEIKQRLDAKCWKGKHKEGTKIKGGVRVNNCVPNESKQSPADKLQRAIDKERDQSQNSGKSFSNRQYDAAMQSLDDYIARGKEKIARAEKDVEEGLDKQYIKFVVNGQALVRFPATSEGRAEAEQYLKDYQHEHPENAGNASLDESLEEWKDSAPGHGDPQDLEKVDFKKGLVSEKEEEVAHGNTPDEHDETNMFLKQLRMRNPQAKSNLAALAADYRSTAQQDTREIGRLDQENDQEEADIERLDHENDQEDSEINRLKQMIQRLK